MSFGALAAAINVKLPSNDLKSVSVGTVALNVAWLLNVTVAVYWGWKLHRFGDGGFFVGFLASSAKLSPIAAGALLGFALGVTRRVVLEHVFAPLLRIPIGSIISGALATLILGGMNYALNDLPALVWELGGLHSLLVLAFGFGAITGGCLAAIPVIPKQLGTAQQAVQPDTGKGGDSGSV